MTNLVLASLFLPLSHFLISSTVLRTTLVRRLGEGYFSLAYSLVALVAFGWLIAAYRHAPTLALWVAPVWVKVALVPIILAATVLVVAGLTTPNPVIVRSDGLFKRPDIVRGVLRITRNPFFWGVGLFAIAHVIMAGHLSGILAFGSVGFLALAGAPILDAKKARTHGRAWDSFAAATSDIPFLAIVQGRQGLALREIGLWRSALAMCVFLAALLFHQVLFGGNPLHPAAELGRSACFFALTAAPVAAADVRLDSYRNPKNEAFRNFNQLYLDGVRSGLIAYNSWIKSRGGQPAFCMPGNLAMTTDQTEDIMLRSADKRAAKCDMLIALLLLSGLQDTFPCERTGSR